MKEALDAVTAENVVLKRRLCAVQVDRDGVGDASLVSSAERARAEASKELVAARKPLEEELEHVRRERDALKSREEDVVRLHVSAKKADALMRCKIAFESWKLGTFVQTGESREDASARCAKLELHAKRLEEALSQSNALLARALKKLEACERERAELLALR